MLITTVSTSTFCSWSRSGWEIQGELNVVPSCNATLSSTASLSLQDLLEVTTLGAFISTVQYCTILQSRSQSSESKRPEGNHYWPLHSTLYLLFCRASCVYFGRWPEQLPWGNFHCKDFPSGIFCPSCAHFERLTKFCVTRDRKPPFSAGHAFGLDSCNLLHVLRLLKCLCLCCREGTTLSQCFRMLPLPTLLFWFPS